MKRLFIIFSILLLASPAMGRGANLFDQGEAFLVLDQCDATTGWSALSNDTTGIDTDSDHVIGSYSLEFDKVDGAANKKYGGVSRTLDSVSISGYYVNDGYLTYSLNVSATTDIAYCFARLGTDASNYNEYRVDDAQLTTGWQRLKFSLSMPDTSGNTGDGLDETDIDYLAVGCMFDAETDTLADLRIDDIRVQRALTTLADLGAFAVSHLLPAVVNVVQLGSNAIDLGAGNVGSGTQRFTLATDDAVGAALQDDLTSDNDAKELADYFDSTSQLAPLYVDDATLTLDNEPISDAIAALYDTILETTDGTSLGDILDDALFTSGAGGTRLADVAGAIQTAIEIIDDWDDADDHAQVDLGKVGGTATAVNSGVLDNGTQRVTVATDDEINDDLDTIAGDTTSLDGKVTTTDADTGAGTDDIVEAVCMMPGSGGASMPDVGAGAVGSGTPRATLADDDPAVAGIEIMDDWDAVEDSAAASDGPQIMGEAKTSQKAAVDDGDAVRFVTNDHGELVIAGFSWVNDYIKIAEQDPLSEHHDESTPVDETNLTTDTTAYVYWDMDGYRNFSLQCDMNIETDSITATIECSIQDDGTAQASCFYSDVTSDLTGSASVVDSDFIWIVDTPVMFKYCRLKYVTSNDSGNDSDLTCYLKKGY